MMYAWSRIRFAMLPASDIYQEPCTVGRVLYSVAVQWRDAAVL